MGQPLPSESDESYNALLTVKDSFHSEMNLFKRSIRVITGVCVLGNLLCNPLLAGSAPYQKTAERLAALYVGIHRFGNSRLLLGELPDRYSLAKLLCCGGVTDKEVIR